MLAVFGIAAQTVVLPVKLIVTYVYSCAGPSDTAKVVSGVQNGVNVVIWFAVDLSADSTGAPAIGHDQAQTKIQNFTCVAETVAQLETLSLPTVNMVSIGGWNAPHPDTRWTGRQWFEVFHRWNADLQRTIGYSTAASTLFDGIGAPARC